MWVRGSWCGVVAVGVGDQEREREIKRERERERERDGLPKGGCRSHGSDHIKWSNGMIRVDIR